MNLRPSGYEPDELPDCSTPRHHLRNIVLAAARDRGPGLGGRSKPSCKDHRNRLACDGIALGRPGSDLLSHTLRCSTIGAEGLHGRVRDGIGCVPLAIATRSSKRDAGTGPPYAPDGVPSGNWRVLDVCCKAVSVLPSRVTEALPLGVCPCARRRKRPVRPPGPEGPRA